MTDTTIRFEDLGLSEAMLKALEKKGYGYPTTIQAQAIPHFMQWKDVIAKAPTGTGKTFAFGIPMIEHIQADCSEVQALILAPTRELALQIGDELRSLLTYYQGIRVAVLYGGAGIGGQIQQLEKKPQIVVATPGRLMDHYNRKTVRLDKIRTVVLDEADRMLDMGFIHDIKRILPLLPKKRQSLFFSATMPPEIERLAGTILHEPEKVEVTPVSSTVDTIDQSVYFVEKVEKINLLKNLLEDRSLESVLVFTRTKYGADKVARVLNKSGIGAEAIHGDKGQNARQRALSSFKDHTLRVLIATDIASRGIDVDHLSHVINYDLPNVPETYVHRIGRTGRAGRSGIAFSFCDVEEVPYLKDIQKLIGKDVPVAGGHMFETAEVKEAVAEKKKAMKEESKRRNMFGNKRDGSFWRNKKRTANK